MNKRWVGLIITAILLPGCTDTVSTPSQVTGALTRVFSGYPANEFFYSYGLPIGEFDRADGMKIYRWSSLPPDASSSTALLRRYRTSSGHYQFVDNYHGITQTHYCELRMYADQNDMIMNFAIAVDSMGEWSSSHCSDLFAQPDRK